jgi:hypothetical protein
MSKNKEKRCITCGKRLLDENLPICLRCRLQSRNTTVKVGEVLAGAAITATALISKNGNGSDNNEA